MDAGQQRLGEIVDRLSSEAPPYERADRFVVDVLAAGHYHLERYAQLSAPGHQRRLGQRAGANRKTKERSLRDRVQLPLAQHIRDARLDGRYQPIGKTELAA